MTQGNLKSTKSMIEDKLKKFRQKYRVSQKELAEELQVTKQMLSSFEKGKKQLSDDKREELERLLLRWERQATLDFNIDYLRIRFPHHNVNWVLEDVLGIKKEYFQEDDSRLYGYVRKYSLDSIVVLDSVPDDSRGVLIQLAGDGCRLFERFLEIQGSNWFDFLYFCLENNGNVTRIDLAVDDYQEYLPLNIVLKKIEKNQFYCRFKNIRPVYEIKFDEKMSRQGISIYFGSRTSEMHIIFYQKNYELAKKLKKSVESIDVKNRYELRFADDYAMNIVSQLINDGDVQKVALGVLADKICLYEKDNKTEWSNWSTFLNNTKKLRIVQSEKEDDYVLFKRKQNYLLTQALGSVLAFEEIDDILGTSILNELKSKVLEKENRNREHFIKVATTEIQDMILSDFRAYDVYGNRFGLKERITMNFTE